MRWRCSDLSCKTNHENTKIFLLFNFRVFLIKKFIPIKV
jgi:hypothetical protein